MEMEVGPASARVAVEMEVSTVLARGEAVEVVARVTVAVRATVAGARAGARARARARAAVQVALEMEAEPASARVVAEMEV